MSFFVCLAAFFYLYLGPTPSADGSVCFLKKHGQFRLKAVGFSAVDKAGTTRCTWGRARGFHVA